MKEINKNRIIPHDDIELIKEDGSDWIGRHMARSGKEVIDLWLGNNRAILITLTVSEFNRLRGLLQEAHNHISSEKDLDEKKGESR